MMMTFYTSQDREGNIHVQNAAAGALGQHHVHSPAGFARWRKPGDSIQDVGGHCDCGLIPGQVKGYEGKVSTLPPEYA